QQAEAAHRAAEHLRAAYGTAAAAPLARLHKHGTVLTPTQRRHHAATLHDALPDRADRVLAEPGWPALAATLDEVRRGGGDPCVLLRKASARRELHSA
ncbi:mobilization protein, partial [Streptomyces sp. SID11233]|nr:mobilization protein [Streptomyces sp. SID11233]